MKTQSDQYQVIVGGGATPSLADAATLTAPDSVTLTASLAMARRSHARLRLVLSTLFGTEHPNDLAMKEVNVEIM